MHDSKNALSVQKLTAELAAILRTMDEKDQELADVAATDSQSWLENWTTSFWETLCREWASIDQWRMNKVLLLVRFFLREFFRLGLTWAASGGSAAELKLSKQVEILETWPLSPRERKVPDGLRLHVLDVWADELTGQVKSVQNTLEDDAKEEVDSKKSAVSDAAEKLMTPVQKISREALSKGVKMRAKEALETFKEATP
jgi:ribosomal RNA-processing protein 1